MDRRSSMCRLKANNLPSFPFLIPPTLPPDRFIILTPPRRVLHLSHNFFLALYSNRSITSHQPNKSTDPSPLLLQGCIRTPLHRARVMPCPHRWGSLVIEMCKFVTLL